MPIEETVAQGQQARAAGRWDQARACFETAQLEDDSIEALLGLAEAQWWLGDAQSSVKNMERAYSTLREAGALEEAATTALWLSGIYFKSLGNRPASSGWISRAARIIDELDAPQLHGWLCWARASETTEPAASLDRAERALAAAQESEDGDLELCALSELGRAYVGLGRVQEGMSMIDEAIAAALGGESGSLDTVVATCCSMMVACDLAADLKLNCAVVQRRGPVSCRPTAHPFYSPTAGCGTGASFSPPVIGPTQSESSRPCSGPPHPIPTTTTGP